MKDKKKVRYFKFLDEDGISPFATFDYRKYLPKGNRPGKWLPTKKKIFMCAYGYHAATLERCTSWFNDRMFEVELAGKIEEGMDKVVAQRMRFLREIKKYDLDRAYEVKNARRYVSRLVGK